MKRNDLRAARSIWWRVVVLLPALMLVEVRAQTSGVWAKIDAGSTANFWGVGARHVVVDGKVSQHVIAVGEHGAIYLSTDEGLTWRREDSGVSAGLTAVRWVEGFQRWFVVGDQGIILSSPDGTQWVRESSPTTARLNAVAWEGRVIAVGAPGSGVVSRGQEGIWRQTDAGFGNRSMRALEGGIAVGQGGAVFFGSLDEGAPALWQAQETPTTADLEGIAQGARSAVATGSVDVAVGEHGTILRRNATWSLVPSGTTERLRGICWKRGGGQVLITLTFRVDLGEFFAVGEGGTILRSSHGVVWQRENVPTRSNLNAVAATVNAVIAVGNDGAIVRTSADMPDALPRIIGVPRIVPDDQGRGFMQSDVAGGGAITYLWVAVSGGAPFPVGADGPRQPLPGPGFQRPSSVYQLIAANAFGVVRSETFTPARLLNLSTLARAGAGEATLIAGFALQGNTGLARTVLIRAVGPTLRTFGVEGVMTAPRLVVYSRGQAIASNAGWSANGAADAMREAMQRSGAFPLPTGSADAALALTLPPGLYTVHVDAVNDQAGAVLLEVYDTAAPTVVGLSNLSARAEVRPGTAALVGGLVVEGGMRKRLLIRAAGPALAALGVRETLAKPRLRVIKDGTSVAQGEAWSVSADVAAIRAIMERVNAFAFAEGSADAALIVELESGAYTIAVESVDGASGVALIEVYEVP